MNTIVQTGTPRYSGKVPRKARLHITGLFTYSLQLSIDTDQVVLYTLKMILLIK